MKSIRANTLVPRVDPTRHLLAKGDKKCSTRLFSLPWSIQFGIWFSFVFALKATSLPTSLKATMLPGLDNWKTS